MVNTAFFKKYQKLIQWLFKYCQWIFQAGKMGHRLRNKKLFEVGPNFITYELYPYYSRTHRQWRVLKETQFFGRAEYALKLQKFLFWLPVFVGYDFRTGVPILKPALIGLTTDTFCPDAHPESTSVDGFSIQSYTLGSGVAWATIIAAAGINGYGADPTERMAYFQSDNTSGHWRALTRAHFLFDTSALPDGDTITSSTFSVYVNAKQDGNSITPSTNIYATTPASNTAIAANGSDFAQFGSTAYCDTALTYAGLTTTAYNDFVLNATGIAAVSKTGITKIGLRNANYDVAALPPSWVAQYNEGITDGNYADNATDKPKLVVVHHSPVTDTSKMLLMF